ncbi:hypothetical protein Moror_14540, partial [Moniliophthora roreri MCA 2997]
MQSPVSYDLILYILSFLADKSQILYRLALVNREFNQAASKILYAQVILCPSYHHIAPNLKDNGLLTEPSQFISAKLPRYSSFVERLHIAGFLSTRAPPNNKLHAALCKAVQSFTHLQSVSFTPVSYHEDIFVESLKIIQKRSTLEELTVNRSCFDEPNITNPMSSSGLATLGEEDEEQEQEREPPITKTQLLASFRNLIKLSLHDPTRAILQALIPGWLDALSGTLTDLHLMGNCGSITPGVLRSAIPHLERICSFSIGLSYSLTDQDVFNALSQLPNLNTLRINYYLQNTSPPRFAPLRQLRALTVCHNRPETRRERDGLCKWIRKAVATSPLERLSLEDESESGNETSANLALDPLIDHLVAIHAKRLKVLDMRLSFVGVEKFRFLCSQCTELEEMSLVVDRNAL